VATDFRKGGYGRSPLFIEWKRMLYLCKRCGADEFEIENDMAFWRETITIVDSKIPRKLLLFESSDVDANAS
jgi:hypothetical protein